MVLLLWFALLGVAQASATLLHASENRVWEISNIGYDAPSCAEAAYDDFSKSSSTYDVAPSHVRIDSEERSVEQRASLAPVGRLLAAKGLDQTYALGLQSSRSTVLQANRAIYDEFISSGGTFIRQRDVARFASDGVTPVLGQYNSVQNSITLFRGSNLSTISEELIHFKQIQGAGFLNKPFPKSLVDGLESDAATVLQQWGYKPL